MNIEDLDLKNVMYYMQKFVINAGSVTFEVPRSMIISFKIIKEFYLEVYPYYYITANIPLWLYNNIMQDTTAVTANMNLQYRLAADNERLTDSEGGFISEYNGRYKVEIPANTNVTDITPQKELESEAQAYNSNYTFNEYMLLEMRLYNIAAFNASYGEKPNTVLTNTNVTNAIAYCFSECKIENMLMSRADNNKMYREFKILPYNGIRNMLRIVEDYKFHTPKSILFFDLNESYLQTRTVGCHVWKPNEYKTTYLLSLASYGNDISRFSGLYINNDEKYNAICFERESFMSETVAVSAYTEYISNQNNFVTITTSNAIMSVLTPNKEFIVSIDNAEAKNLNGSYRLYSYNVDMVPNGELLRPVFNIKLCR